MSHTVFNALTNANYHSSNGINSSNNTLDIAINISTTNNTQSPIISEVNFNVTTSQLIEKKGDSSARIRYLNMNKTEITNITDSQKTFQINILPNFT